MKNFWGIDVGGKRGTISTRIFKDSGRWHFEIIELKHTEHFRQIWIDSPGPIAIDAPLTYAPSAANGFRPIDEHWRETLSHSQRNWVISTHSLLAVPIKGLWLIQGLPETPVIIECHPRVGMKRLFQNTSLSEDIEIYKSNQYQREENRSRSQAALERRDMARQRLWDRLSSRFHASSQIEDPNDDQIDSFFCALLCMEANGEESPLRIRRSGIDFAEMSDKESKLENLRDFKQMILKAA